MSNAADFDDLQSRLDQLAERFQDLDDEDGVALPELVTDAFVSRHTRFKSLDELFAASGFKVETQEDFAALPEKEWDQFIRSVSGFDSWQTLLGAAGEEWAKRKLGL